MIKQAVIIAAGKGKRMREGATDIEMQRLPKPLLPINGELIIERKIKKLKENNIEVCIVINPDAEGLFREKLAHYDLTYCYQEKPLGVPNAVYCAKDFVREDLFLLLTGDDLIDYDADAVLNLNEPAIFGFEVDDVTGYGVLIVDKQGYVETIKEKERSGKGIVNTAMWIMPKEFFDVYKEIKVDPRAKEQYLLSAIPLLSDLGIKFKLGFVNHWFGINTPAELQKAKEFVDASLT